MVQPSARSQKIMVPLPEPVGGVEQTSAVLSIPEWWPTGSRTAAVIAHDIGGNLDDPLITHLEQGFTERKILTLRFNFPFAEAGRRDEADSMEVLERCYRTAVALLAHDPTATPARLLLGGKGLGARVAARVVSDRVGVDAAFFLGFPLHPPNQCEAVQADLLYRITCPMLFIQGTRDHCCDLNALRRALRRVGAPTSLITCEEADHDFQLPRDSLRADEDLHTEVLKSLIQWADEIIGES